MYAPARPSQDNYITNTAVIPRPKLFNSMYCINCCHTAIVYLYHSQIQLARQQCFILSLSQVIISLPYITYITITWFKLLSYAFHTITCTHVHIAIIINGFGSLICSNSGSVSTTSLLCSIIFACVCVCVCVYIYVRVPMCKVHFIW